MPAADTRTRLLDASVEAAARHGLSRLSLEDVARVAGVSRQTIYRYFRSREELLSAAILREEERLIDRLVRLASEFEELRPALEVVLAEALRAPREHPLLDRLLETEPESLLPFLATGSSPVLSAARPAIERVLGAWSPQVGDRELRRIADMTTRLLVSYALAPPDDPVEEVAAGMTDLILHGVKGVPT